ncbi:hypothetical protein F4860DRAFT_135173 [Xylaria cubensis]|nr:hypothetical protein F4860DRAFT_135173 [Xylaria cubensis]
MVQYISGLEGLESKLMPDDYKRLPARDPVNISSESRNEKFATKIVDSLLSKTMDHQEEVILSPGARRMAPLYDQGESNGLYLVIGKPGSGKSTLMKFLASDKRLSFNLRRWCNGSNPLLAAYFSLPSVIFVHWKNHTL